MIVPGTKAVGWVSRLLTLEALFWACPTRRFLVLGPPYKAGGARVERRENVGTYKSCTEKHIIQATISASVLSKSSNVLEELPPSPAIDTLMPDLM